MKWHDVCLINTINTVVSSRVPIVTRDLRMGILFAAGVGGVGASGAGGGYHY